MRGRDDREHSDVPTAAVNRQKLGNPSMLVDVDGVIEVELIEFLNKNEIQDCFDVLACGGIHCVDISHSSSMRTCKHVNQQETVSSPFVISGSPKLDAR